jgi:FkbM family methyltransferase
MTRIDPTGLPPSSTTQPSETRSAHADRELQAIRWIGHHLPPFPHITALINRVFKPWYLRRKRAVVLAHFEGFEMELDPAESMDGGILFYPQLCDRKERRFLSDFLHPGDTFVDVGGNIGFYTLLAARLIAPSGQVLAIEADPNTAAILRRHLDRNGFNTAKVLQIGVSDSCSTLVLNRNITGNRAGNSFLYGNSGNTINVECKPLLMALNENGIVKIDCMKMDIEGFEHRVLKRFFADAPRSLWPRAILMEYVAVHDEETGGSSLQLALSLGYLVRLRTAMNVILVRQDV